MAATWRKGSWFQLSIRARILTPAKAINITPATCIAIVNAISDSPQVQFSKWSPPLNDLLNLFRPGRDRLESARAGKMRISLKSNSVSLKSTAVESGRWLWDGPCGGGPRAVRRVAIALPPGDLMRHGATAVIVIDK